MGGSIAPLWYASGLAAGELWRGTTPLHFGHLAWVTPAGGGRLRVKGAWQAGQITAVAGMAAPFPGSFGLWRMQRMSVVYQQQRTRFRCRHTLTFAGQPVQAPSWATSRINIPAYYGYRPQPVQELSPVERYAKLPIPGRLNGGEINPSGRRLPAEAPLPYPGVVCLR